jgi:maltose O-acetyltransferase
MTFGGNLARLIPALLNQQVLPLRVRNRMLRLTGADFRGSSIGPRAQFSGTQLRVGDHTFFNEEAYVDAHGPVTIGKNVSFGPQVMILTTTHEHGPATSRAGQTVTQPVTIGDGVWVGARVTILPGATIGSGAVIAAGAVVNGDLPANGMYGGVPAKLIRMLDGDAVHVA